MRKTYCLDTNVLLSDAESLFAFDDNDLIVPLIVLDELDRHKNRIDEVGANARKVNRTLDEMRQSGDLCTGITLRSGGTLKVVALSSADAVKLIPFDLAKNSSDNIIIALMKQLIVDNADVTLVSRDINMRVKCDALSIKCQDYLRSHVVSDLDEIYKGFCEVMCDTEIVQDIHAEGSVMLSRDGFESAAELHNNEFVVMKSSMSEKVSALARVEECVTGEFLFTKLSQFEQVFGVRPRNKEQQFACDALMNPDIKLVTLCGIPGGGKTLLSMAAGLEQLRSVGTQSRFSRLIVTRPIQSVGADIGFLPGTMEEKMKPWLSPIWDNMKHLLRNRGVTPSRNERRPKGETEGLDPYISLLIERGIIEVEAITYMRGRSIADTFMLIDECQNMTSHELKTIITRVGENTKVVLTGDLQQIDNPRLDAQSNGLTYAIEKFKDIHLAAHVTFLKGERSELATIASKIL